MSALTQLRRLASAEVARNFAVYGVGALFLSGISFFLVPIYTRVIPPEEYGRLELLNTGIAILSVALPLGLAQSFFLEFYHHDNEGRRRMTLNISALYLLFAGPVTLVLLAGAGAIRHALFSSDVSALVIAAALLTAFLGFYRNIFFSALRLARKAVPLVTLQIISGLAVAALNIYFVYYRRLGIAAIIGANLAAVAAASVVAVAFYFVQGGRLRFDLTWRKAKGYVLLGLPLMPASVAVWMLNVSDRWVLTGFGYAKELGLYSLAYKFGTLYSFLVVDSFAAAYTPRIFARYGQDLVAAERHNGRVLRLYLAGSVPLVTVGVLIGQPAFRLLVGRQYYGAYGYILPIMLGYVLVGATSISLNLPLYQRRSAAAAGVQMVGAAFNVAMNLALVRWYGAWAAALMTLAAFALAFVLALWLRARMLRQALRDGAGPAGLPHRPDESPLAAAPAGRAADDQPR
jgi:O-antigen/teichoic acid export membrane protein